MTLRRPDDVYQALMDAQAELTPKEAEAFRARLILLLADAVGDDDAVIAAIEAASRPPTPALPHKGGRGR